MAEDRVIRHARVNVVLNSGLLCGIGKGPTNGDLVAPVGGVDESALCALEQIVDKLAVLEAANVDGDVFQFR